MRFLPIQLALGLFICTLMPFIGSSLDTINQLFFSGGYINLFLSAILVSSTIISLHNIQRFPGITSSTYIIPVVFFWFILIISFIKLLGISYSFYYYCISGLLLLVYLFFIDIINRKHETYTFAYIPVGRAKLIPEQIPSVNWLRLQNPHLGLESSQSYLK